MFALVDCNNFYASCERVFRPDLNGKPVVVLSNNDGCVIARSNEAKLYIPMGAPAFKFEKEFNEHNITVFSANFALYGDLSNRVMSILNGYSEDMEIYSIDEAFLKFENTQCLQSIGLNMRQKVKKFTGIPISVGIAPTKALAKAANRIAKKYPKETQNVYTIDTELKRIKALKWLKVEDVWGIGSRYAKKLNSRGVRTAYEFTQMNDLYVKKNFTIQGLRLKQDLLGIETLDLEHPGAKKNIATTRTFENNYTELKDIRERVVTFAVTCAEKLRKQKSCCNEILVFLHTNGFRKDLPQYSKNIVIKTPFPTNSSIEIAEFAVLGLERIFKYGYSYKKAGVIVMNFTSEYSVQTGMFGNSNPKHKPLMNALDTINKLCGKHLVKLASQDPRRTWKMRQERLSPRYTTNINDIIKVKL